MKVKHVELKERQALPFKEKIIWAIRAYIEFVEVFHERGCYIAFSGGKDSQVLAHTIDSLHAGVLEDYVKELGWRYWAPYKKYILNKPAPPKVFSNTGLEFNQIRKHVYTFSNVVVITPRRNFAEVIQKDGFLIGSKKVSRMLHDLRTPTDGNALTRHLYDTGINSKGEFKSDWKLPLMYRPLIDQVDFNISEKCCDVFKKEPFKIYEKQTGRVPIIATMTEESSMRRISYYKTGCNVFEDGKEACRPISIWTLKDIWQYHDDFGLKFCELYYEREIEALIDGVMQLINIEAEERTGCVNCGIGPPKEVAERFKRLRLIDRKKYDYFVHSEQIKMSRVLEKIGIMNLIEPENEKKN